MNFSTKAKNLLNLKSLNLKKSKIPKFYKFTIEEIFKNKTKIMSELINNLSKKISIRSSFLLEDQNKSSMAGEFDGLANVKNSKQNINNGIKKLIKQYKVKTKSKKTVNKSEILFQNYVGNSILSGVVTNYCIKDGTDYYVINYDDTSSLTNTVTSGNKSGGRVINIFKKNFNGLRSKNFQKIITAIKEIEEKIQSIPIDVEFAIDKKGYVNIFQIRPLSTTKKWKKFSSKKFEKYLKLNQLKFLSIFNKNKDYGKTPIFGLMPDWNPAEMIGYHPNNFSYSLYEEIITNRCWSKAREKMGYTYVNKPLMHNFAGKPYIDTRLSFNSLIPKKVKKKIKLKLIRYWSEKLIKRPYLHDKIEFDIIDGSFDASLIKKIKKEYIFLNEIEKNEYFTSLQKFTNNLIQNYKKVSLSLNDGLKNLEDERIKFIKLYLLNKKLQKKEFSNFIIHLKKNGTIPFSIYARYAFIAKKILNSFVKEKFIKQKTYSHLLNSVGTITNSFIEIEKQSKLSEKSKKKFNNFFYHLRPGTYDIEINRYNNFISNYKIDNIEKLFEIDEYQKIISKQESQKINKFLKKNKFNIDSQTLINFCLYSIKMRENSKFIFTRSLSDIIEIVKNVGKTYGISKQNLAKLPYNKIFDGQIFKKKEIFKKISDIEKIREINTKIKLPYLITNKSDFYISSILVSKPNFITKKIVESEIVLVKSKKDIISNKIVVIENADPGFDWIFSKNIKGLITKFGGVNSHMSIRCEELSMPAAIGIGEDNFNNIKSCSKLILNCRIEKLINFN